MYCPQCAAQNADGAKFCRSCGLKLEAVALALSEASKPPTVERKKKKSEPGTAQDWMEKRIKGMKEITGGLILLLISLLIGVAMALFVPHEVPWMLVWVVFFGWLACWGGIGVANGIGNLLEAKSRLRMVESAGKDSLAVVALQQQLPPSAVPQPVIDTPSLTLTPSLSVTEGTTRELNKH